MKNITKILTICTIPLLIMGCNEVKDTKVSKDTPTTLNSSSSQEKMKKAYQDVKGLNSFSSGSMMSTNQAYVIFDSQCIHCAKLWKESKKVKGVNFNWIPVGFLNQKSTQQGAVILSSSEPVNIMNVHEDLMSNNLGGMMTNEVPQAGIDKIKKNTEFFKNNFESVPVIIFQNNKTKEFGLLNGAVPKVIIDEKLGLN